MRQITFPSKEIIPKKDINKLIKVKTKKNPFRSEKESEEFYQNIIEEEMILSNDYNFANIEKLLNLYIKGINLHQKTLDTKEIYYFQEKINLLLNTPKVKSIINKEKKKTDLNIYFDDNNNNSFKIEKRPKNNNDINLLRSKTYKNNIALNSFKLKALNQSIKQELEAKEYQKKKIDKINKELFNKNKSVLLLKDDFKNQANNFKEKLLLKRKNKLNMSTINKDKENNINNKNKSLTAVYSLNKKIEVKEEISIFKLNGYSFSAPKELEMLKNKIKCEIYNNIYNILNK